MAVRRRGPVEVDELPLGQRRVARGHAAPDPRLLAARRPKAVLDEAHVGDDGDVADDARVRVDHRRVLLSRGGVVRAREVEVVLVEVDALDEVAAALGLEAREVVAHEARVREVVAARDGVEEPRVRDLDVAHVRVLGELLLRLRAGLLLLGGAGGGEGDEGHACCGKTCVCSLRLAPLSTLLALASLR